jgi:hypothetical protein
MRTGQRVEVYSTTFGLVASAALHLAAFAYISSATAQFDFDFELTLPAEVELGLTEGVAMSAEPAPPGNPGPTNPSGTRAASRADHHRDEPTMDAGTVADLDADAGTDADAGVDADAGTGADAGVDADADAGTDLVPIAAPTLTGPSRIPPGAQLALRVDMKRVRESPLAGDVTSFLSGVPDWQLLLDGSGIDPVADLDRLLVATPNLQRSKLALAGRNRHGERFARESVQRLARSRGQSVRWRQRYGVPTAPWYNLDDTPRTIALLSPHHFSITRRQDLGRILAMTKARELRSADKEGLIAARGPDALLSMGPDEVISLEIEGVHQFVIGSRQHIPVRLRVAVRDTGAGEAAVSILATYASQEDARAASIYWKKVTTFYSQQLIMTIAGFGKTLRRMDLKPDDGRIQVSFTLNADQIRFILSYAEGRLRRAGATPSRATPTKKGP